MRMLMAGVLMLALATACGGGGSSAPVPPQTPDTPPILVSIEADPIASGQYLLNVTPGIAVSPLATYVAEVKWAGSGWIRANVGPAIGIFTPMAQIPTALSFIPEGTTVSLRVVRGDLSPSLATSLASNSLDTTLLPFRPNYNQVGFDESTGRILWRFHDNSLIPHGLLFEISGLDAQGQPQGWEALAAGELLKDPQGQLYEDKLLFTEMPAAWEGQTVLLRARTVDGPRLSISPPRLQAAMGLAVPSQFTALPGPSGITLAWKTNTKSASAVLYVLRTPGPPGAYQPGDLSTVATLPASATQWVDPVPLEGTYHYQLLLLDGGRANYGPMAQATTSHALTWPAAPIPTPSYRFLAVLPNGNVLSGLPGNTSFQELRPDGSLASTLDLPSDAVWDYTRSITLDPDGQPHLLFQTFDQSYVYRHAWKESGVWQVETLPKQVGINAVSNSLELPRLFFRAPDETWVLAAVSPTSSLPISVGMLRKANGQWTGTTITAPGTYIPNMYSTGQCLAVHSDGTVSLTYASNGDQILLQRRLDGSIAEWTLPFLPNPEFPSQSMPVVGLLSLPGGPLRLLRLGGVAPQVQSFDGTSFSALESIPVPPALITGSLSSQVLPSLSGSGARMAWVLTNFKYSFVCLSETSGWRFFAAPSTNPGDGWYHCGFLGEAFWQEHIEADPLRRVYQIVLEKEP